MSSVFGEELKKILLVGIGAVAASAEKSKDIVDELVKKGEVTVEQGKVLNEELKRKINDKKKDVKERWAEEEKSERMNKVLKAMEKMTPEELEKIKEKLNEDQTEVNEES
ncbi:MAG: hypothetical protein K5986_08225 [Clostridium sp.]|uniref:phasin family protein n=1 Tax=Clostridium sp. DSM 8431 TaxID=1761781 RepID=UPI0008ECF285|nr:hypothetical protein [Clostridium sp. DSM 8431]MCR4944418.1 hypothetical protein [Clostridium sp.]SFU57039.1 Polyhydroxyalkanoate synthesis regulator phasin [Clostridium sp. DSM 8431]